MYKRIIAQADMKGKRQMRSYTPGTQGAAMSMDYPPMEAGKCARRGTEACRNS